MGHLCVQKIFLVSEELYFLFSCFFHCSNCFQNKMKQRVRKDCFDFSHSNTQTNQPASAAPSSLFTPCTAHALASAERSILGNYESGFLIGACQTTIHVLCSDCLSNYDSMDKRTTLSAFHIWKKHFSSTSSAWFAEFEYRKKRKAFEFQNLFNCSGNKNPFVFLFLEFQTCFECHPNTLNTHSV